MVNLRAAYRHINRKYYDNRLPKDVLIQWSTRMPSTCDACCHVHGLSECSKYGPKKCRRHILRIHPSLKPLDADTMLRLHHEIVHISAVLGDRFLLYHGKHFNDAMKRLAVAGAFDDLW